MSLSVRLYLVGFMDLINAFFYIILIKNLESPFQSSDIFGVAPNF